MIIYLLTFYLFDDIEKKYWITHANHSATSKAILTKMHVQAERPYSLFCFALVIIHGDHCDRKTQKNNYFIQVKCPFSVVEFSNTVTF